MNNIIFFIAGFLFGIILYDKVFLNYRKIYKVFLNNNVLVIEHKKVEQKDIDIKKNKWFYVIYK